MNRMQLIGFQINSENKNDQQNQSIFALEPYATPMELPTFNDNDVQHNNIAESCFMYTK